MSLKVNQLTKKFGNQVAVNAITFEASPGEILGFLGPNGAGKSTTMKVATTYLPPTSGAVKVCEKDVVEESLAVRKLVGYLPEHNPLYLDMYVKEYLSFIGSMYKLSGTTLRQSVQKMIELCRLELEQRKLIGALSKGYRQRVGLAQALIHDPQVLILDEPTTGLDPNQLGEIRHLIKEISREKTVIFSTHIMQEVQALCDRVVIINRGNIVVNASLEELNQQGTQPHKAGQLVEVEFSEPVDVVLLEQIPEVSLAESLGNNSYRIQAKEGTADIRPVLFQFACTQSYILLEMRQKASRTVSEYGSSLEEIFRNLTVNGK